MATSKKKVRLVEGETETVEAVETPVEAAATEPATPETKEEQTLGPRLRITLTKSGTGYKYDQKRTLVALGLRRMNTAVERPDNASVRGMLTKVQHLVQVEEIGQS